MHGAGRRHACPHSHPHLRNGATDESPIRIFKIREKMILKNVGEAQTLAIRIISIFCWEAHTSPIVKLKEKKKRGFK